MKRLSGLSFGDEKKMLLFHCQTYVVAIRRKETAREL